MADFESGELSTADGERTEKYRNFEVGTEAHETPRPAIDGFLAVIRERNDGKDYQNRSAAGFDLVDYLGLRENNRHAPDTGDQRDIERLSRIPDAASEIVTYGTAKDEEATTQIIKTVDEELEHWRTRAEALKEDKDRQTDYQEALANVRIFEAFQRVLITKPGEPWDTPVEESPEASTEDGTQSTQTIDETLAELRDRNAPNDKPQVTVLDGVNLVIADINENRTGDHSYEDEDKTPTDELDKIRATLEKIQDIEGLSYQDLSQTLNYLRVKRNKWHDRYINSSRQNEDAETNSRIYEAVIRGIYDAMPFAYTVEAVLPEYPNYTPSEHPLTELTAKVEKGENLKLADAKKFYADVYTDVAEAVAHANATDEWGEHLDVLKQIDDFIRKESPSTPLLVTVKEGKADCDSYTPQTDATLHDDLQSDDGSTKFIFDPNTQSADMRYLSDVGVLNVWMDRATDAVPGIKKLVRKLGSKKLTSGERNGVLQIVALMQAAVERGQLPDRHMPAMEQLRELVGTAENKAQGRRTFTRST